MAKTNLSFQKITTVPATGLIVGRIYFETSTGMIKVATSATAFDKFGDGVKSATWDQTKKLLKIINESGEEIDLNLSDVASASSVTTELSKKLNIGTADDASTVQSYYGLKKYTDNKIAEIPKAVIYKGDGTTITQNGSTTVTFSVGTITQEKVNGLSGALDSKATTTALNAVKATADAAAPKSTVYTKSEVDDKVSTALGSVYKVKGSVTNAAALTALTGVTKGDTYNVTTAGSLNGEAFEAGSNFVAVLNGAGNQEGMWDKLGGTIDLSTYATKAAVTSEINTKIGTLDKADSAVAGQLVSAVTEVDGIITVSRRALVSGDIPTLDVSKIDGLSAALGSKVEKTTTVNNKALSQNIVLAGEDILVGGNNDYGSKNIQEAVVALDSKIKTAAAAGVQSFGGKTGAITVDTTTTTNGQVKFTMVENQLKGSVAGLGSAAYANTSAFDVSGSANTALRDAKAYADALMTWSEFE